MKLLKQLHTYIKSILLKLILLQEIEPYYGGRYHNFEDDNGDCVYAAPYQAELQEWLLKVNIFVSVRMLARDNSGYFFWELFVDNTQIQYSGVELHKTYEEALEAGLYKALKQLI